MIYSFRAIALAKTSEWLRNVRKALGTIPLFIAGFISFVDAAEIQKTADSTFQQTAFRVRSDVDQALNSDSGWAGKLNQNVVVNVDEPFRIRFEVENAKKAKNQAQFQLQYRRNDGEWQRVDAENFPLPEKVLKLNFEDSDGVNLSHRLRLDSGDNTAMAVVEEGGSSFLQVKATKVPVLGVGLNKIQWQPVEFAVDLRLPKGQRAGGGIIFGYLDPQNYYQISVDATGAVRVSRFQNGEEIRIAEKKAKIPIGQWFELKLSFEADVATIEIDDQALAFAAKFDTGSRSSGAGFFVPENSTAHFKNLIIEGKPGSPRVSIVASEVYEHGQKTTDLLASSSKRFVGGAGISFADLTPVWSSAKGQSEWEWPLVIRRFADGAVTNDEGDAFEFRMADAHGRPLASANLPKLTATVPSGHLGGTFVETPARIGPWQAANGDLYFLMEPAETYNVLMTVKSTDRGKTWREVDGANRPTTGDLEGFATTLAGDTLHMLHQTSDHVLYHALRTSDHPTQPDTWAIRDERLASPPEPPTQVADIAVRTDGTVVGVYGGPHKIHFKVRSPKGSWGKETVIDADVAPDLSGPMMVLGKDDVIHLAYTGNNGTAWYRRLQPNGELTPREQLTTQLGTNSDDVGSILPLVYLTETNTVSIIYRLGTGKLWERRSINGGKLTQPVLVSDYSVAQSAVDSEQTGADTMADGTTVHVLFIEEQSRNIFHTRSTSEGNWTPATALVESVNAQWIRGTKLMRGQTGKKVYGYVYDAGSNGGSGKNRYGELPLEDPDLSVKGTTDTS